MTDADVDGSHIRTLLLTFFYRHMVALINHGHLFIAQPPLYRATIGKTQEWIHSEEELERVFAKKAFDKVSIYSKDGSIKLTGIEIRDFLDSLKELNQGLADLEKEGIPRELSAFLLKKDESFYHLDFSKSEKEVMLEVAKWFQEFDFPFKMSSDPTKGEYWIEFAGKVGKTRLDKRLLEHPILHKCFKAYPQVKKLIENQSYIIVKKDKEIGKDIPWYKLAEVLEKISDRSGVALQRYKGLGEMSAEQLWETTMNPVTRTLLTVSVDDATKADHIFHLLMGGEVPPRKAFIQAHAKSVRNLDI